MKPSVPFRIFIFLFSITIVTPVAVAWAQPYDERLEFYTDAGMVSCELVDDGFGFVEVHVFHVGTEPAISITFAAPVPACWSGATWTGEQISWATAGNTQTGIDVGYYACVSPPIHVGYMFYQVTGVAETCCTYGPSENPIEEKMVAASCPPVLERPLGARGIVINPDESCRCLTPIPVEETSWGRVKALYRE